MADVTPSQILSITAKSFDADYLIEMSSNGEALLYVGTWPVGAVGEPTEFRIWLAKATGDDEEGDPVEQHIIADYESIEDCWGSAARDAYAYTIGILQDRYDKRG